MNHTKAINAICAFGLVLATVVTFDYMNPHSLYHQSWPYLVASAVGGIAVIACWGMFTACEDSETRRRLIPFCIPLTGRRFWCRCATSVCCSGSVPWQHFSCCFMFCAFLFSSCSSWSILSASA